MGDIIKIISDFGISIACVGYLIYFSLTTMKDMNKTLNEVSTSLRLMNQDIEEIKQKLNTTKTTKK
jgi:uncharacterized protein YoxC